MKRTRILILSGIVLFSLILVGIAFAASQDSNYPFKNNAGIGVNTSTGTLISSPGSGNSNTSIKPPIRNLPTQAAINSVQSDMAYPFEGVLTQHGAGLEGSAGQSGLIAPESVLWDNGPLVTHPAACGAMDASRLQSGSGMNTYGFSHQYSLGYRMADDFIIDSPYGWNIQQITFFAYQTNAPLSPSSITGVYYQIWDGPPNDPGSSVVYGNLVSNRLLSSTSANIQRDLETSFCPNNRYIFTDVAQAGVTLPPGTYWLDWMTDGSSSYTGPWAPPITILGQTVTGNALQNLSGSWYAALDSGTSTTQGLPFIIEGSVAVPDIEITPRSLFASQYVDELITQSLQICNTGTSDLSWNIFEKVVSHDEAILLIETTVTTQSLQRAMDELGYVYDYYSTFDEWSSLDFSIYDIVILGIDGGFIEQSDVKKLRTDVIDTGKRLIIIGGSSYEPFAMGVNQYIVLNDIAQYLWASSSTPHLTIVDPDHPLAQRLPTPYNYIDPFPPYYSIRVSDPSIDVVAMNGDGYATLFYKGANFPILEESSPLVPGDFIWFTSPPDEEFWTDPGDYAILKQVIRNALEYNLPPTDELSHNLDSHLVMEGSALTHDVEAAASNLPFASIPLNSGPAQVEDHSRAAPPVNVNPELLSQPIYVSRELFWEGFEDNIMPPTGWSRIITNPGYTWKIAAIGIPYEGAHFADVEYDPALVPQNEVLLSPILYNPYVYLDFWTKGSVYWCRDTYDNCDLNIWIVVGSWDGGAGDDIFLGTAEDTWTDNWIWSRSVFDLSAAAPDGPYRIGFQYIGTDGAQIGLDAISVKENLPWLSVDPFSATLNPDKCTMVDVTFDSTGMIAGGYLGALQVSSNDPDESVLNVMAHLSVIGRQYIPMVSRH